MCVCVCVLACTRARFCFSTFLLDISIFSLDLHWSGSSTNDGNYETHVHSINPLKPELNPICYLLALLGAHHFFHVSRIRVKLLTLR